MKTIYRNILTVIIVMTIGNMIRVSLETSFCSYGMRIIRSFFVVMSLMTGGCMIGTSAM